MGFKFHGTHYFFTFGFFMVLALYMLFDRTGAGLPALCCVALHECGHIAAMHLVGARVTDLQFCAFGVRMKKQGLLSYGQEAAVYFGGAAANLAALAAVFPFVGWNLFTTANAALAVFNLLPIGRLDGGVLLHLLLCRAGGLERADLLRRVIGFVILTPLFAGGFWLLMRGNCTLLFTAVYLAVTLLCA